VSRPPDAASDASRALGSLLAVAAHELSSPMTGILAFARYAAQHSDPKGRIHELLLDIEREALRCTATIQELLLFARVSGIEELAPTRLADLVQRVLAELAEPLGRNGIALACEIAPDTRPLRIQAWSVQRALVSLLSSSIDALAASQSAAPRIALSGGPDAGGVLLVLTDNGPGTGGGARSGQALARAVVGTQGGTLTVHEHGDEVSLRLWLPAS
jgi:signal transduction histidine kinase